MNKNTEFFKQEKELDDKGATNMQKQRYYTNKRDREKAKSIFVKTIS